MVVISLAQNTVQRSHEITKKENSPIHVLHGGDDTHRNGGGARGSVCRPCLIVVNKNNYL